MFLFTHRGPPDIFGDKAMVGLYVFIALIFSGEKVGIGLALKLMAAVLSASDGTEDLERVRRAVLNSKGTCSVAFLAATFGTPNV